MLTIGFQSPDRLNGMYENAIFPNLMAFAWFNSNGGIGIAHNDLFKTITLPCMALVATAVSHFSSRLVIYFAQFEVG